MTAFVDASAMVAILAREPDAELYQLRLADEVLITSALSCWEAARATARRLNIPIEQAGEAVAALVLRTEMDMVAIGAPELSEALAAHGRYGKGRPHPARLNMGDCFAYACAKTNGARLLYKGDDFDLTDMAWPADA